MEAIFLPSVAEKYNFRVPAIYENVTIVSKSTSFIVPLVYHVELEIYFIKFCSNLSSMDHSFHKGNVGKAINIIYGNSFCQCGFLHVHKCAVTVDTTKLETQTSHKIV
jgi:hypothetical protein